MRLDGFLRASVLLAISPFALVSTAHAQSSGGQCSGTTSEVTETLTTESCAIYSGNLSLCVKSLGCSLATDNFTCVGLTQVLNPVTTPVSCSNFAGGQCVSRSGCSWTTAGTPSYGVSFGSSNMGEGSPALAWLKGDVNGDGKTDILQPWNNGGALGLIAYTSNGTGYTASWGSSNMGEGPNALAWLTGDVNGDGKTDILQPWDNGGALGLIAYTSNGTGYAASWGSSNMGEGSTALAWLTGDVNGDGKTDIIQPWNNGGRLGLIVYTSNGTGYVASWGSSDMGETSNALAWLTGDVNGDGRTDIIQPWNNGGQLGLIVYTSNGTGYVVSSASGNMGEGPNALAWLTGDVNGDGKTDVIQPWNNGGHLGLIVYTSNGTGYSVSSGTSDLSEVSGALAWLTGDVNGDGKTDIIEPWNDQGTLGVVLYTSNGAGYSVSWGASNMGEGAGALAWLAGDVNGDGKTDVIQPWNAGPLGLIAYTSQGGAR